MRIRHGCRHQQGSSTIFLIVLTAVAALVIFTYPAAKAIEQLDEYAAKPVAETAAQVAHIEAAERQAAPLPIPAGVYAFTANNPDIAAGYTLAVRDGGRYTVTLHGRGEASLLRPAFDYARTSSGTVVYHGATVQFRPDAGPYPGLLSPRYRYTPLDDGRAFVLDDGIEQYTFHPSRIRP